MVRLFARRSPLFASLALLLALPGCGAAAEKLTETAAEKAVEQATGGDVELDTKDGGFSVKSGDGSLTVGSGMPKNWPSDIPLPKGFAASGGSETGDGNAKMLIVAGTTTASLDEVRSLYDSSLSSWTRTNEMTGSVDGTQNLQLAYRRGDRAVIIGAITRKGAPTEMTVTAAIEPGSAPASTTIAQARSTTTTQASTGASLPSIPPVGLKTIASAVKSAMKADDVRVDGNTLHVYLSAKSNAPVGTECVIVTAVAPKGTEVVIHRDGTESTC